MDSNQAFAFSRAMKSWINPKHAGRNKSPAIGMLMGFLLGPIGVALYFRSLVEGGLSLVAAMAIVWLTGLPPEWMGGIVGAAWAVGRILHDNQPPTSGKPAMPGSSPPSPEPDDTHPAHSMA